ncbi:hypothetical protein [Pontibacter sp. HJ8]
MLKLYYETEAIRVSYDEELQLGKGEWKGFVSSDIFRSTALHLLEFVTEHRITRWLSDRSHMTAILQPDQQWMAEEFIPKIIDSPLRRMANVLSSDTFKKMTMEQIIRRKSGLGSIAFRDFETVAEALEWLQRPFEEDAAAGTGNGMERE